MIKASDLRIGNLVYDEFNHVFKIKTLFPLSARLCNVRKGARCFGKGTPFKLINPIPITEKWLLKLGLLQDQDGILFSLSDEIHEKCKGDIGLHCPSFFFNKRLNRWMDCQTRVCVDYIHQVQNLIYCLTGEELNIENL
jgi:hypothetical protein